MRRQADLNIKLCASMPMATITRAIGLEGENVIEFPLYQLDRATLWRRQAIARRGCQIARHHLGPQDPARPDCRGTPATRATT